MGAPLPSRLTPAVFELAAEKGRSAVLNAPVAGSHILPPCERLATPATAVVAAVEGGGAGAMDPAGGVRSATSSCGATCMSPLPPVSRSHVSTRACHECTEKGKRIINLKGVLALTNGYVFSRT